MPLIVPTSTRVVSTVNAVVKKTNSLGSSGTRRHGVVIGDINSDLFTNNYGRDAVSSRLNSAPVLTTINPSSGTMGQALTISGTQLAGATQVTFTAAGGSPTTSPAASFTTTNYATNPQSITLPVPASLATGTYVLTVTTPDGTSNALSFVVNTSNSDLVVSTAQTLPGGTYRNVTITGPTTGGAGILTLGANLTITGTLTIQYGGLLDTQQFLVLGNGNFMLADGGQLTINNAQGISGSGATGAIQVTGTRSYSTDGSYSYTGNGSATSGITGTGLPAQVRNLQVGATTGHASFTLSQGVAISQVLKVVSSSLPNSALATNGYPLALLSSAQGTALISLSKGEVNGQVAVERYINPNLNAGSGYRHYSSPVQQQSFAGLATSGFAPERSQAGVYNSSPTPGTTTPFPTVFDYDESRIPGLVSNMPEFNRGWHVPTQATLAVGRGYTIQIAASEKIRFLGDLNVADQTLALSYTPGNQAGWNFIGNPYAAPLNWSTVSVPTNLVSAMYVFQSTGPYTGQYRSYVNGVGSSSLIPSGQGFFVRTTAPATLTLSYENCVTDYATANSQSFQRLAADTRPRLSLALQGSSIPADSLYVYAEAGATTGFDARYDAEKLPNTNGLNLAAVISTGTELAIQGLPALGNQATIVPLAVQVPQLGRYMLAVGTLVNFPPGTLLTLHDQQRGTTTPLSDTTRYAFQATNTSANGRFYLKIRTQNVLATTAQALDQQVQFYPNPAHGLATLYLPASTKSGSVSVLNTLGQTVRTIVLPAGQRELSFEVANMTQGVYQVLVPTATGVVSRRLVVE